jgi:hypothetical protein
MRFRLVSLFFSLITALLFSGVSHAAPAAETDRDQLGFGSRDNTAPALIGILYDLKQNQARESMTMNIREYHKVLNEFFSKNWDESVLNRRFRVTRPLYTTQIFIPLISANAAPTAFRVENVVKPSYWLCHYKGQVSAPSDGEWRFWGWGEEVCSVAINGEMVLMANWPEIEKKMPDVKWKSPEPPGQRAARGRLVAGDWISLKKDEIVDLDILIGERAGGVFCSFVLIEKKGEIYAEPFEGHPVLPVFRLGPSEIKQPKYPQKGPKIVTDGPIWNIIP